MFPYLIFDIVFLPHLKVVEMVQNSGAMSVFVASDRDHMIDELNTALKSISPKVWKKN